MVRMIVGSKVWEVSRKMATATLEMAKQKYLKENVNAIVGVEKGSMITLQKDVFDNTEALDKAVNDWTKGGYTCHYVKAKGGQ